MAFSIPLPHIPSYKSISRSPLITTTLQAICINILANIIAQYIEARQRHHHHQLTSSLPSSLTHPLSTTNNNNPLHDSITTDHAGAALPLKAKPAASTWGAGLGGLGGDGGGFEVDLVRVLQFVIWTCITVPLNFKWQVWLEKRWPGNVKESVVVVGGEEKRKSLEVVDGGLITPVSAVKNKPAKKNVRNTVLKILCDQGCAAPINCSMFLMVMTLLKGGSLADGVQTVRAKFWTLKFAGWRIWPLMAVINFNFVPVNRRVIVSTAVGLCWNVFLALFIS